MDDIDMLTMLGGENENERLNEGADPGGEMKFLWLLRTDPLALGPLFLPTTKGLLLNPFMANPY